MIKIQTSGDYVQLIYVDPVQESVQQELKSDTDAFECSYDSDGKLFMQFGAMRFEKPDPTDFEINGVAVTDAADFISKLNALFTGGGGGGATIYTGNGSLIGPREIQLDDNDLAVINGVDEAEVYFFLIQPSIFRAQMQAIGQGSSYSLLDLGANSDADIRFDLVVFDGTHTVEIKGDATTETITMTGILNLEQRSAPASPNDGDIWREDNTNTGLKIRINGVTKTITVS